MHLRTGIEIHLPGDACEAPEVLIFQIRAVAPAHHLHSDEVAALLQVFRDIELGSHLRVLRIAHILTVHPEGEVAGGRTDMEEYFLSFPVLRQVERPAIRTRVVVGLTDIRWIALESRTPGIADVLVDLVTIAVHLKQPRHRKVRPLRVIVLQGEEPHRHILMILHEVKLPHALHREEPARLRFIALGLFHALEGEEIRPAHLTVHLVHVGILPHWCLLAISRHRHHTGKR